MKVKKRHELPLPRPLAYIPPFVSQKPDPDGRIDDCTWASGLMLVATWTSGEVVTKRKGGVQGEKGLKRLRRLLREESGALESSSLPDLAMGVHKTWPALSLLDDSIHGGSNDSYSFKDLWKALNKKSCAVVQGQRGKKAKKGELYLTTGPHAVFVHHADPEVAYVQDPMWGYAEGKSRMREVPKAELEQFAAGLAGGPHCLVVVRGSERAARRVVRPK